MGVFICPLTWLIQDGEVCSIFYETYQLRSWSLVGERAYNPYRSVRVSCSRKGIVVGHPALTQFTLWLFQQVHDSIGRTLKFLFPFPLHESAGCNVFSQVICPQDNTYVSTVCPPWSPVAFPLLLLWCLAGCARHIPSGTTLRFFYFRDFTGFCLDFNSVFLHKGDSCSSLRQWFSVASHVWEGTEGINSDVFAIKANEYPVICPVANLCMSSRLTWCIWLGWWLPLSLACLSRTSLYKLLVVNLSCVCFAFNSLNKCCHWGFFEYWEKREKLYMCTLSFSDIVCMFV